ncbi:RT0821/Lpp0805 family surface protein [Nitratireductor sp. GISD-1A_MAKvit]
MGLRLLQCLFFSVIVGLLAGCSVSALDLEGAGADIDRYAVTGSISPVMETSPALTLPAGTDAMLHAMVAEMGAELDGALPLSWADEENGVRGVISHIYDDGTCRSFVTTRESFDGISLYRGTACPSPEFGLQIQAFEAV